MIARLNRDLLDPRTYGRIAYLLLAGVLGIVEFTFLVTTISVGVGLAVTLIGIPILILCVYAWGGLAELERRMIGALTGRVIPSPYRPLPEGGRWEHLRARLADPATWKDLAFLLLQFPFGLASFVITCVVLGIGIQTLTVPLWYWAVPGSVDLLGLFDVDTLPQALVWVPFGALVLTLGIPALGALGRIYAAYAEILLGSNEDPAMSAEMTDLRDARSRLIEAADAERRRIERDLHDGAQQRLVALALTLRMAEKRAAAGDPGSAELVRRANEEASMALKDLRDLARGIHPAILTNRGLAAALEDLAGRASVPVEVVAAPDQRLPDQVEAAAYFVVSECLVNVDKHAQASSAKVAVRTEDGSLVVVVSDDGVGGAVLDAGSGLQGLQDRVGALNGSIELVSPPTGGTEVRASIPLYEPLLAPAADAVLGSGHRSLGDAEADALLARRRHGLRYRLAALGTVAGTIVTIWLATGAPNDWPVWPLMGLGFFAALDVWFVLGNPPLRRSELAGQSERAVRRKRKLRANAGVLAIVNLLMIGIWLAAGAAYFWPIWVMLGSAIELAFMAIPWPEGWHERLEDVSGAPLDH